MILKKAIRDPDKVREMELDKFIIPMTSPHKKRKKAMSKPVKPQPPVFSFDVK